MRYECCENCFYWDYIDDRSESNAKRCYFEFENSEDYDILFYESALCLSENNSKAEG